MHAAIQAISQLTETLPVYVIRSGKSVRRAKTTAGIVERGAEKVDANRVQQLALCARNQKVRSAAASADRAFTELCSAASRALEGLQGVCLACSRTSNDDNPSNHGQVFVSLDALANNTVASSSSGRTDEDDGRPEEDGDAGRESDPFFADDDSDRDPSAAAATGDFIHRNALPVSHSAPTGGVTRLPFEVEDHLRKMLHAFSQLSVLEQNLVFQMMHGESTLSDFATMNWVPAEMRRRQSKQWVSQRWAAIVEKFPAAAALRKIAPARNIASERSHKYSDDQYDQREFDFGGFSNPAP